MLKRRSSCMICEYQPVSLGGLWSFMPIFCCETRNARKASRRKKAAK